MYEIPFNRHFYVFKPPRPLSEIDADLKGVTDRILTMIGELSASEIDLLQPAADPVPTREN
jgi:hypothetical protein